MGAVRRDLTGARSGDRRHRELPHQVGVTFVAAVRADRLDSLRALLAEMGGDPAGNAHIPFGRVGGIHYARFFLLEPTADLAGNAIPGELFFMVDFDSPIPARLDNLLTAGAGWEEILGHCEGFAGTGVDACKKFFREHAVRDAAYYVNTVGLSVDQVRLESSLREALEQLVDGSPELHSLDPAAIRAKLVDFVRGTPALEGSLEAAQPPELAWQLRELGHLLLVPVVGLILLPLLLVAIPLWLVALRLHERADVESAEKPQPAHLRDLEAIEDFGPVNQFTAVGFIKPGWFRTMTARTVLFLVNFGARHIFNHANLAGVKTIHFARWTFFDGGRRVVFASNYDGALESYMDDFIDKVAWGLNAVFSNGVGWPATRWLLWGGARHETAFKNFLRVHQAPTQVWYSAYPTLTALNIANNSAIRAGLRGGEDERSWLSRL